ncbi:MAG: IS110 family transposase [Caldisericum sp.]|uniref:IS110 family transposase n=1 Tax=Caldisericum sp. TaxID=2499687 RepID=UPI003D0B4944
MNYEFYVGVDVSKDSFAVCIKDSKGNDVFQSSFTQSLDGFQSFLDAINRSTSQAPSIVGMESTSIYYLNLMAFLIEHNINTVVINPSVINKFSKLDIRPYKSDKKDASTIAQYLSYSKPEPQNQAKLSELKILVREREKLVREVSYLKDSILRCIYVLFPELERNINIFTKGMLQFLLKFPSYERINKAKKKAIEYEFSQAFNGRGKKPSFTAFDIIELADNSIGIHSKAFEEILISNVKRLLMIEEEIDKFDHLLSCGIKEVEIEEIKIISSIPGIGNCLATSFVCELPSIDAFRSEKSLIAFVGIDPVIKQSGRYKAEFNISKRGNRHLRRIIYLMAMNVIRFDGRFRDYFHKLRERGKSYMVAIIATANKLLRTIYSMLIHGTFYSPNYS